ncbi:MAG: S9 family peptidase, partial [Terriglobales bacterium]
VWVFLLFAVPLRAQSESVELTLEAIFSGGGLIGRPPQMLQWSPDSTRLSFVLRDDSGEQGALWHMDLRTGRVEALVPTRKLATLVPPLSALASERERERRTRYNVAEYHWAPDGKSILFDSHGQLWLYRLETGTAVAITLSEESVEDSKFSPDGARISYVRKHNLYVRELATAKEKPLTTDADENLLNGEVDWVYAEELDVRSNQFWSPQGEQIAFLQMDESAVPAQPILNFNSAHSTVEMQKYPNAGDANPAARVGVVSSRGGRVRWVTPVEGSDFYIPRFGWVREGLLWVQVLNRAQDQLDLYFVETRSGRSRRVLRETSDAWVEVHNHFRVLPSGGHFLWASWRDGHTHLYLYRFDGINPLEGEATLERQLTRGEFDVFSVDAVDEKSGRVFFTANRGDARERHLYSVGLDGSGWEQLSSQPGTQQASFSPDSGSYVLESSSLLEPPRFAACRVGGECRTFWEPRSLAAYALVAPQFVDFKAADGTVLHGALLLPPGAEKTPAGVPLLLAPYGGPGAQTVRNAWGGPTFLFHQLLARRGIAVLQVDNRGMAARGKTFAAALRRNLGEVELDDQLAALDQALERFPALDRARVAIWGWSYGGYMTLNALTRSERFRAGVAVAPVTDWRNYDSIYTERYMGLPQENAEAYRRSSPLHAAQALHGNLLLVHGTADDNVHLENTMQMADELIKAGKQFELMLYPGKTHGIYGTPARVHLFRLIQQHLESELLHGR